MRRSAWPPTGTWSLAVFLLMLGSALAESAPPAAPAEYRITGTVVSARDGAPVPFCRISATASSPVPAARTTNPANAERFNRSAQGPPSALGRAGRPGTGGGSFGRNSRSVDANPETKADSSGRFTLDLPHGGSWRLEAAARGFRSQGYDEHDGFYSSIVLSEASPAYEAKFQLTPDAIIGGLVLDETGDAVAGAQVVAELIPPLVAGESRASPSERPRQVGNAQTDDRGRYELAGLTPAAYRVRVQAQPWYAAGSRVGFRNGGLLVFNGGVAGGIGGPVLSSPAAPSPDPSLDMVYASTWYPSATSEADAETITLGGGEERQVDFHLTAIPAAHLVVSRPDTGQPEPTDGRQRQQRPVTITRVTSDGSFGQTSFIGGNGRDWDFGGLAPGTYEVRLPGTGGNGGPNGGPNGNQDGETRQIEVRPGGGGVVTLDGAKALTRVAIRAEGLPQGDFFSVEFFDTETNRSTLASAPPRGRREGRRDDEDDDSGDDAASTPAMTTMLPPHHYQVRVNGGSGAYLTGISATGAEVVGRTVTIGEKAVTLSLRLATARAEISGVAKLDGQPVSGAMVLLVPVTLGQPGQLTPLERDQTNTDGSFLLQAVVPGRYILVAIDHGWRVDWHDPATLAGYLAHGMPLEVKGSAKLREELAAVLP